MMHGWGVLDQPGIKGIMRQGSNRRPRPRGNQNKQRSGGGRNSYDSNGPAGKVRGTAQQVLDKYQALGRDAMTSGDRIGAESYFQFAEHYHRIVHADGAAKPDSQQNNQDRNNRQNPGQAEVVEVPVVDASAAEEAVSDIAEVDNNVADVSSDSSAEAAAAPVEVVAESQPTDSAAASEEIEVAPKAPRRRRSRAKVEKPVEAETEVAAADA
jgi:hypothetical protein